MEARRAHNPKVAGSNPVSATIMTTWLSSLIVSGTNRHVQLTSDDERELERMARKLHEEIHCKGNQPKHLDVPERKIKRALEYGAHQDE